MEGRGRGRGAPRKRNKDPQQPGQPNDLQKQPGQANGQQQQSGQANDQHQKPGQPNGQQQQPGQLNSLQLQLGLLSVQQQEPEKSTDEQQGPRKPTDEQQGPGKQTDEQKEPGKPTNEQQGPGKLTDVQQQTPRKWGPRRRVRGRQQQPGEPISQQQQPTVVKWGPGSQDPAQQQPALPTNQQQLALPTNQQQQPTRQTAQSGFRQHAPTPVSNPAPTASPPKAEPKQRPSPVNLETFGIELRHKHLVTPELPPKPPPGKSGRPIKLISNLFSLEAPCGNVYHYDVEIICNRRSTTTKEVSPKDEKKDKGDEKKVKRDEKKVKNVRIIKAKRNREIMNLLVETNENFKGMFPAYDGKKNLFTRMPLKIGGMLKCNIVIVDDENPGDPNDPRGQKTQEFEVTIKPVRKSDTNDCSINLDSIHALFAGHVRSVNQEALVAVETILKHGPCNRFIPAARSFFCPPSPQDIHPLGGGLEIWFGYHQSLRLGQWKPAVNIDLTASAFYLQGPVLNFIKSFLNLEDKSEQFKDPLKDYDISRLSTELKNVRVKVSHLRYIRNYRIIRLSRESANELAFHKVEGGKTVRKTVAQHFAKNYKPLLYPHLPCLQVHPEKRAIYIPIEVCDIIEGQHSKKKMTDKQTAEMIKFTAKPPKLRFEEIRKSLKAASFNQDPRVREFDIRVSNEPLALEGRVIDAPNVRYDKSNIMPRDGAWDMRGKKYFRAAEVKSWVLLSFDNPRLCGLNQLQKFADLLCNIASGQGMNIKRPETIEMFHHRRESVQSVLTEMKRKYSADLVVVVVPEAEKSVYGVVKQAAEKILGLVTQCIKGFNVARKCNDGLVSNLCQKINAKMGGVNNSLNPSETPAVLRKPVMIIGADVTHPNPGADHEIKPSIAACVGSLDAHPSRYAVTIRAQIHKNRNRESVEIIMDLKEMVVELLMAFYKNTRAKKPEKIIFYRDGVSEGQFHEVRRHEIQCVRAACRTLDPEYQPGITFIIVQKRHHVRFMPQDERAGSGKMRNIPPGTTVDNTVVHPLNFDFFLCSHFGLQGTSRPSHYTVIEDDNDFTADDVHKLTYYLCYIYARCTRSISCPAPVQYAHLAAFRARHHLLTQMDTSSASSSSSSSSSYALPEAVINAVKVAEDLKNTMYFV